MDGICERCRGLLASVCLLACTTRIDVFHDASTHAYDATTAPIDAQRWNDANATSDAPPAGRRNVWIVQGQMARTVLTCDGGLTWRHDRSDNDNARCGVEGDPNYVDCSHHSTSAHSLTYGDGWFFAKYGHGAPGTLRRSQDGISWETFAEEPTDQIGDLAFGGGRLIAYWENAMAYSSDKGESWISEPTPVIDFAIFHEVEGHIFLQGRENGFLHSSDGGMSWAGPTNPFNPGHPATRFGLAGMYAVSGARIVAVFTDEGIPTTLWSGVSTDHGATWEKWIVAQSGNRYWEAIVHNGNQFVAWTPEDVWTSVDGVAWTETPLPNQARVMGPVAYDRDTERFINIYNDSSTNFYAGQFAQTSTDGITWTRSEQFVGGHPVMRIVRGYVPESVCASN